MQDFLPMITGAISGAAAAGLFKGPVQTLQDYWYIHFGHHASEQAEMLRVQQEAKISDLRDRTLNHVSKIEPENIQKPKLQILGPALEATNFYIEEESLREMFAKLMASSMDKSKTETLHPAFVDIVKQMTPLDAANLKSVFLGNQVIGRVMQINKLGEFRLVSDFIFINDEVEATASSLASSIDNLARLNLVTISFDRFLTHENAYDKIYSSNQFISYQNLLEVLENPEENASSQEEIAARRLAYQILTPDKIELDKGKIELTSLGNHFCQICLSE